MTTAVASVHESHYDLVAAAIATAAATMLTLLTTLGSSNSSIESSILLRGLLEVELLVLEFALLVGVVALLQRNEARKRRFTFASASLLILGNDPAVAQRDHNHRFSMRSRERWRSP